MAICFVTSYKEKKVSATSDQKFDLKVAAAATGSPHLVAASWKTALSFLSTLWSEFGGLWQHKNSPVCTKSITISFHYVKVGHYAEEEYAVSLLTILLQLVSQRWDFNVLLLCQPHGVTSGQF